jgi:hypothetical protein
VASASPPSHPAAHITLLSRRDRNRRSPSLTTKHHSEARGASHRTASSPGHPPLARPHLPLHRGSGARAVPPRGVSTRRGDPCGLRCHNHSASDRICRVATRPQSSLHTMTSARTPGAAATQWGLRPMKLAAFQHDNAQNDGPTDSTSAERHIWSAPEPSIHALAVVDTAIQRHPTFSLHCSRTCPRARPLAASRATRRSQCETTDPQEMGPGVHYHAPRSPRRLHSLDVVEESPPTGQRAGGRVP